MRLPSIPLAMTFSIAWLLLMMIPAAATPVWHAKISPAGSINFSFNGKEIGPLEPGLFEEVWRNATLKPNYDRDAGINGIYRSMINSPSGIPVDSVINSQPVANGLHLTYQLTPKKEIRTNSIHVSIVIPANLILDGQYVVDGVSKSFPAKFSTVHIYSAPTRTLILCFPGGEQLNFTFATPTQVMVQDDRQWGGFFSVRIGQQYESATTWPAEKSLNLDFTLTAQGGMDVESTRPITVTANKDWLPYDGKFDVVPGSALDFTNISPRHTPAGKYGRVIATNDGKLAFENQPKTQARFCGVNLCFSAQYLTHEQADMLATRLQRLGYTAVRFHHYENYLVDQSKGDSTRLLKPQALDQLDYLFAALKKRGIYITTDLFVIRNVLANEIWDGATGFADGNEYKMAVPVNERAYANYLAFMTNLLNHVNPYTKMRWADDPTLAWISFINEGNEGNYISRPMTPRCKADWTRAWNAWLAARYPSRDALTRALGKLDATQDPNAGTVPLPTELNNSPTGVLLARFLADTDAKFFAKTRDYLHNTVGCKALFTNLNGWTNPVQVQATRQAFDYVDDHFYIDHPQFLGDPWKLPSRSANTNPVTDGVLGGRYSAFVRLLDKPLAITEFNYCAPGKYRGASGLLTGSIAALQDWSAIWRFTYSHGNGSYFAFKPAGYFDLASDPMNQAADRAAIFLFSRGDLRPATHSVAITMTQNEAQNTLQTTHSIAPDWNWLALVTRVGSEIIPNSATSTRADLAIPVSGKIPTNAKAGKWLGIDPYNADAGAQIAAELRKRGWMNSNTQIFQSDTKELTVDPVSGTATIDTPRTVGGFAVAGKQIATKYATISVDGTDATVWISSLDNASIAQSRRLLISHLTDLENTGEIFADESRGIVLDWGDVPYLVRKGTATVRLHLQHPDKAHVWGLAADGTRTTPIATSVENKTLVIPLATDADGKARMHYEVVVDR